MPLIKKLSLIKSSIKVIKSYVSDTSPPAARAEETYSVLSTCLSFI